MGLHIHEVGDKKRGCGKITTGVTHGAVQWGRNQCTLDVLKTPLKTTKKENSQNYLLKTFFKYCPKMRGYAYTRELFTYVLTDAPCKTVSVTSR